MPMTKDEAIEKIDAIREHLDELESAFRKEDSKSPIRSGAGSAKGAVRGKTGKPAAGDDLLDEGNAPKGGKPARGGTGSKKSARAEVEYDDVKTKFAELIKEEDGERRAKALLKSLGVKQLRDLDADQYADALAQAQAAIDEGEPEAGGDGDEGDGLFD